MPEVEADLAQRLSRGEELVVATVVRLDGAPPSRTGAKALFDRARQLAGTLGCSEFDSQARADAAGLLSEGAPAIHKYRHDLGSIDVYLEPYLQRPLLVVIGDTPIARSIRRWAPELGFEVAGDAPAEAPTVDLYVVHTDHDAPDLVEKLELLLAMQPRFTGVMGSRRHTGHHLDALRARGLADEQIGRIQSPVGLDLGAQTPAEIALSILAGLVAVRRGGGGGWKQVSG